MLKKLAGQTAVYGLSSMVGRLLNYFLVPLHTYFLSKSEYGINTDLYAWVSFFNILYVYGLETAFFRFGANASDRKGIFQSGVSSIILTSILFSGSLFAFADSIAEWLFYPGKGNYIRWFSLILAFDAIAALPFAKLRLEQRAMRFVSIKTVNILINIGLNLFFFYIVIGQNSGWALYIKSWLPVNSLVGFIFMANLLANGSTLLMLLPEFKGVSLSFDWPLLKRMTIYSFPLMIAGFAGMVNEMIDRILLKYLLPLSPIQALEQTGIYGAVYKLSILMALFTQTFRMAAEPFFFEQAKKKNSKELFSRMMNWFVAIGVLVVSFVLIYLDVFKYFINEKFWEGLPAVAPLIFSYLFLGIYYNLSVWYKLTDNTKWGMYIAFIGMIITILGNVLTIPTMGYMGSAYTTLICYFSIMVICFYVGQKKYSVPYQTKKIAFYIVGAYFTWVFQDWVLYQALATNIFWMYGIKTAIFLIFAFIIALEEFKQYQKDKPLFFENEN